MNRRNCLKLMATMSAVTACNPFARPSPTRTPPPPTVRFAHPYDALSPQFEEYVAAFVEAYGSPLGFEVANRNGPGALAEGFDAALLDQLQLAGTAAAGLIRPLDPMLQEDLTLSADDFVPAAMEAMRWRGETWALPIDLDPWVLYWNQDLFARAGVPQPMSSWTWDDFLAAAIQMTDLTAENPVYGYVGSINRGDFVSMVYQQGATLVDSLVAPTRPTFTDPKTVESLQTYLDLSSLYGVMPTPTQLQALGGFERAVLEQRAAMWIGPLTERGGTLWGLPWPFSWSVGVLPGTPGRVTLLSMRCCAIGAQTQHPDIAWRWITFAASRSLSALTVSPLRTAVEPGSPTMDGRQDVNAAATASLSIARTMPTAVWVEEVGGWLWTAMNATYSGKATITEALEEAQILSEPAIAAEAGRE